MDLGLSGRRALVCASTRGLGLACADALLAEGALVTVNGRTAATVEAVVARLALQHGDRVNGVTADVNTQAGRDTLVAAVPHADILINNNAGPNPGDFISFDHGTWMGALEANMVSPLLLIRALLPGIRQRRFGRIVNVTSAMVTTPRPHMTLSAGARAGLTAALKGLSLQVVRDNVTINNLLPERFDTDRQIQMAHAASKRESITYEEARVRQVESIAAQRLGDPREFGATCAFLCSALAGFLSGQNIHLDGGSYPALV